MTKLLIAALLFVFSGFPIPQEDACAPSGWPLMDADTGRLVSGWGIRRDPFTGKDKFHKGVDIKAHHGTPVVATMSGEVTFAEVDGASGKSIRITCGNYTTVFNQLSEISVKKGTSIEKGQVIGKVGSSGRSTAPHLHYEILIKGKDVNPKVYIAER